MRSRLTGEKGEPAMSAACFPTAPNSAPMTDISAARKIVPDLSIPFDQAILDTIAKPPFAVRSATVPDAAIRVIRELVVGAVVASELARPSHDHALSAHETAIGFACFGAIRLAAEIRAVGHPTQPTDLLGALLDCISATCTADEMNRVVESGMAVFNVLRLDPKLEGLCDAIEDLFVWYARTGAPAYIELAANTLRGVAEARRRPLKLN
jgi:hypothetical protein